MLRFSLALLMPLLLWGEAAAQVHCSRLFNLPHQDGRAIVLTLVKGLPEPTDNAERDRLRTQLEKRLTPRLQAFVDKLAERVQQESPRMLLVACEADVGASDLSADEIVTMSRRNVIAVLWPDEHSDGPTVVHLSVLQAMRNSDRRRDRHEVEWARKISFGTTLRDWLTEFEADSTTQQAMLAMGVGLHAIERKQWALAMTSLCQARAALSLAYQDVLRPKPAEFRDRSDRMVEGGILEARRGLDSSAVPKSVTDVVQLACQKR